jgi:hypothetical protein
MFKNIATIIALATSEAASWRSGSAGIPSTIVKQGLLIKNWARRQRIEFASHLVRRKQKQKQKTSLVTN